jgi:predicted deacylase
VGVEETLTTVCRIELPTHNDVEVVRRRFQGEPGPRVALLAGIRGDTPEGVRVLYGVTRLLRGLERIAGTVDLYPCANVLAAYAGSPRWPFFEVDLDRRFPGRADGHPPDRVAWELVQDIRGADVVLELRSAYGAFRELAQAHVGAGVPRALELAQLANVEVVWVRERETMEPTTFAAQFETVVVLEGGAGNRISEGVGSELTTGVVNVLASMGVVEEGVVPVHWAALLRPVVVHDEQVCAVRSDHGGVFFPAVQVGARLGPGDLVGTVVEPCQAAELQRVAAPAACRVLALREQPPVHTGSLVARLVLMI